MAVVSLTDNIHRVDTSVASVAMAVAVTRASAMKTAVMAAMDDAPIITLAAHACDPRGWHCG